MSPLPTYSAADRRDRRLRWIAVLGTLAATQALALGVSVARRFWDPWFFLMLAAPVFGVGLGVLGKHLLRSVAVWWGPRASTRQDFFRLASALADFLLGDADELPGQVVEAVELVNFGRVSAGQTGFGLYVEAFLFLVLPGALALFVVYMLVRRSRSPHPGRMKLFEIPTSRGVVPIEISDGSMCLKDEVGETWCDGWATIADIAEHLVEWIHLPSGEALSVAGEAVRRWEESLEGRPNRNPVRSRLDVSTRQ